MSSVYFSHSYAPEDRRYNEHIWSLLANKGCNAWIDTGLDGGWQGTSRPMDISFNEWMLSRCEGFVAIVPRRYSPYQALEHRLALRMGLPSLVLAQEGANLGVGRDVALEFPVDWKGFWNVQRQQRLRTLVRDFGVQVSAYGKARSKASQRGGWKPRSATGSLRIALLLPSAVAEDWAKVQRILRRDTRHAWELMVPTNLHHPHDLVMATSGDADLLVLDVGPYGTPREMVGYLEGVGIPQVRVCRVDNKQEAAELGRYLSEDPRPPYCRDDATTSLPLLLDGLKLDEGMQPVYFWNSHDQLVARLKDLTDRIDAFRSGLSPDEGGSNVALTTQDSARRYFWKRHQSSARGDVFLSFAGRGGATPLADRLAPIIRFLDCRCFNYRDENSASEGRLESGELVKDGLTIRITEAHLVILFIDPEYLESQYCMDEMRQAMERSLSGELQVRAYTTTPNLPPCEELKNINVFLHHGNWMDMVLEERIIQDVDDSLRALLSPLRTDEQRTLQNWLVEDGRFDADGVQRLLEQLGIQPKELKDSDVRWENEGWFERLLALPIEPNKRQRRRELIALLLLSVSEARADRFARVRTWLHRARLIGGLPTLEVQEQVYVPVSPTVTLKGLTANPDNAATVGMSLHTESGLNIPAGATPIVLEAQPKSLEVPIEWTRETEATEPIAVRRPIMWRLPFNVTRRALVDDLVRVDLPPSVLLLALEAPNIIPTAETSSLKDLLDGLYRTYRWPAELVRTYRCTSSEQIDSRLTGCQEQIVHIVGHLGGTGLLANNTLLSAERVAQALSTSDVRLLVLNGCNGASTIHPLALEYATLAERMVRDGGVAELVAHRTPLREDDGINFSHVFYTHFFRHFDVSRAAMEARKAGSAQLRLSPLVISQRKGALS